MQDDTTITVVAQASDDLGTTFDKLADKLGGWLDAVVLALPNFVVALLIVVLAVVGARLVRRAVHGLLVRVTARARTARNAVDLLSTLAYAAVLAAGTFVALGVLRLDGVVTSLLAGAGIVGLALGFAFQDIASNFIAGVLMAVRAPFVLGQTVETNGFMGVVTDLTLRSTILETFTGQRVVLPNAKVYGDPIVNYSARGERRVDVACGVGYGVNLERAQAVALEVGRGLPGLMPGRPVQVFFSAFGESSLDFTLRFWVPFTGQATYLEAQSDAIKALKAAFDREGIVIPFPIRTLDFGPSGGVTLREMRERAAADPGAA